MAVLKLLAGIVVLTLGSKVLVSGATTAATLLGVSEAVIGLTIVSAGTSMPELITSLVAALRGAPSGDRQRGGQLPAQSDDGARRRSSDGSRPRPGRES